MWQQIEQWRRTERPWWWAYLFAVLITVLFAVLLGMGLALGVPIGLLLLAPVLLTAYVGGLWPALLSTAVASVAGQIELEMLAALQGTGSRLAMSLPGWYLTFSLTAIGICLVMEALHRSRRSSEATQRQLTATLANIGDAIITTNPFGHIDYMNRAAAALLQHELKDVMGQRFESVIEIHDELDGAISASLTERARHADTTIHVGNRQVLIRPDGTQVPIAASAAPVRDQSGELLSVVLTLSDCSEQRQVENVLRERLALKARFERIAAVVPGAIHEFRARVDGRRQLSYASPAFKEIFGVDPALFIEDAAGLNAMMHPDDAAKIRKAIAAASHKPQAIDMEHRVLTPHRGVRWISLSAVTSRQPDGDMLWYGVCTDVTERKHAEARLRASQLQLSAALEAEDMGIITIDLASSAVELDSSARRLWNLHAVTEPALTTHHLLTMIHPDDRPAATADYQNMMTGPQALRCEYRLLLADGHERWLTCRGRVDRDEVSGRLMMVGVVMDITPHRHAQEQRLHSQKLEALGVLAGGIAHDFNNLLLAISGNVKLLLGDMPTTDPLRISVQEIDKAATRAAELVRRILSFSSVPDLTQPGRPMPLRPILNEVLGLARAVLPATVTITVSIPEQLPDIVADGSQVHQVLINLLTNAADAAVAADGKIRLEVAMLDVATFNMATLNVDESLPQPYPDLAPGPYVCVSVTDNGCGMDTATLQRIFDPFFTTKPAGRGTGLGLAIVHGIMKSVDGAVTVRSSPEQGACFTVYFPVKTAGVVVAEPALKPLLAARPVRILYVDDEESLVFLMTRTLQRMGHRVTAFDSPEQALAMFVSHADDFDLIVSDMSMPVMSGLELAEQVLSLRPELPFIITSGYMDAADVDRAHAMGVRQMIMKPNTVEELSVALSVILQEQDVLVGQASA